MNSLFKRLLALKQMEYVTLDQDFAVVETSAAVIDLPSLLKSLPLAQTAACFSQSYLVQKNN